MGREKEEDREFEGKVSGFNCTIPIFWMASRLRSANSSFFEVEEGGVEERVRSRRRALTKIREKNKGKYGKRRILGRSKDRLRKTRGLENSSEGESLMSNLNLRSVKNVFQPVK